MFKAQHMAHNAALTTTELIDTIASNIVGYGTEGHRAKRWSFSDVMNGTDMKDAGIKWSQGKREPRPGEWTKMFLDGSGTFVVKDPRSQKNIYTRLGDFHVDAQGNMVTQEGFMVQGVPLAGVPTRLRGPDPTDPDVFNNGSFNPNLVDPFNNPITNNAQQLLPAGKPVGRTQDINIQIDPKNGRYLGLYESIKVGEDGVIYGKDGPNLVSLYKLRVVNFNNPEGLRDVKDGKYFEASKESGLPSLAASETKVFNESLEMSNVWLKLETHYMMTAQRSYQAATQLHKLADKIDATAIEMIS